MSGPNNKVGLGVTPFRCFLWASLEVIRFLFTQKASLTIMVITDVQQRPKLHHKPMASDAPAVSPTLTPIIPEPLAPTSTSNATSEELAFFDRVKKYIANKSTMNEFLKLCNLFSQDLIDRNVLVHKVSIFIGGNLDLMNWSKSSAITQCDSASWRLWPIVDDLVATFVVDESFEPIHRRQS